LVEFEPVIGLEVHAQLKTDSKIFCGCPTSFGAAQNEHVCPVCLGMPGVLPVLNKKVIEFGVRIGRALNCSVAEVTKFDRKNYYYPDLPKGYQISQYDQPICSNGHLEVLGKKVRILRAHLEEDAGKLVHAGAAGLHGSNYSLADYNRSGIPLMEIVSQPDIENAEMAREYLMELRRILRYIEVCDGNLEEGSFRCDANVSVRPKGESKLGTKVELKNMNSFNAVQRAIDFEIKRQSEVLNGGGKVVQETRLWNDATQTTHPMRSKEEAHDYRYFPEPDLMPFTISKQWLSEIETALPELPAARRKRYTEQYELPPDDAAILAENRDLSDFYDEVLDLKAPAKEAANLIVNNVISYLNSNHVEIGGTKLTARNLADLVAAVKAERINSTSAKVVLNDLLQESADVAALIEKKGLAQVSDEGAIQKVIVDTLAANPDQASQYQAADEAKRKKLRQFIFGLVMKALKGKGDPAVINKLLDKNLPS
jgi:aspartyl-tRNA(Asn)/glutamyl-tRNA(Gln) amidotransferase subunit B